MLVRSGNVQIHANSNIFFLPLSSIFVPVSKHINRTIENIAKGDTGLAESFLCWPGGRKYLENIMLILINTITPHSTEKEEMWCGFVEVLNQIEQRLHRQREGQEILDSALQD